MYLILSQGTEESCVNQFRMGCSASAWKYNLMFSTDSPPTSFPRCNFVIFIWECLPCHIQLKWVVYIHLGWSHWNLFLNHSTNFLLTNYRLGKSVRTSTLCMTQVIFPTFVYRQIISLIIHCITIPVGQKFTYTRLTVPLNSLEITENYVMALEASDRLIYII